MILSVIIFSPSDKKLFSLVAEPVLPPAIRTRPGDGITGHAPHVFLHASLTDTKTAAARPAKRKCHSTAIAVIISDARSFFPVCGSGGRRFHDCCFKSLMLWVLLIKHWDLYVCKISFCLFAKYFLAKKIIQSTTYVNAGGTHLDQN
jgi:hypothetical protein